MISGDEMETLSRITLPQDAIRVLHECSATINEQCKEAYFSTNKRPRTDRTKLTQSFPTSFLPIYA